LKKSRNSKQEKGGGEGKGRGGDICQCSSTPTFGRSRYTFGRSRDTFGRLRFTFGRSRDTFGRSRDTFGRSRDTFWSFKVQDVLFMGKGLIVTWQSFFFILRVKLVLVRPLITVDSWRTLRRLI
jgi:hypothetical protein